MTNLITKGFGVNQTIVVRGFGGEIKREIILLDLYVNKMQEFGVEL